MLGCGQATPKGIAFMRLTEQPGSCGVTMPVGPMGVDQLPPLPSRSVHGVASFEGGSRWASGDLVAIAWQDPDGTIGRIQVDIGPERGFGVSDFPTSAPNPHPQQAFGYVEWKDGQRKFTATQVFGILNYQPDTSGDTSVLPDLGGTPDPNPHRPPAAFFSHIAIDGVGPQGEAQCRILGLHAATHDRVGDYDPSWLLPNPTMLFVDGAAATYADDKAPSVHLVKPSAATPDPGGEAPKLTGTSTSYLPGASTGHTGGDDGSGSCD
jgi:hypothetical protein